MSRARPVFEGAVNRRPGWDDACCMAEGSFCSVGRAIASEAVREAEICFLGRGNRFSPVSLLFSMTPTIFAYSMLPERLAHIRSKIQAACGNAGRSPESITLIAVTKTIPADVVNEAIEAGLHDIGENRLQEYLRKRPALRPHRFHFIGHLQTNKVKQVIMVATMIHSVDSLHLAREVGKRATAADRVIEILLEVNTSGASSKHGFQPTEVEEAAREIATLPGIRLRGLMTIASLVDDPEDVRPEFRMLASFQRRIREQLKLPDFDVLSMGMTNDFEVAIEEGATHIRLGTALFGPRS